MIIMRAARRRAHLAKGFALNEEGQITAISDKPIVKLWWAQEIADPTDLDDLQELLEGLEQEPKAVVLFGMTLTEFAREELAAGRPIRRLTAASSDVKRRGAAATLSPCPSKVVGLDVDDAPVEIGEDLPGVLRAVAQWALPSCFVQAACVAQLSNSAGLTTSRAKAHLFYLADSPVMLADLKRAKALWATFTKTYKKQAPKEAPRADLSVLDQGHLFYTARPACNGFADPLPRRIFRLDGAPAVTLPELNDFTPISTKQRLARQQARAAITWTPPKYAEARADGAAVDAFDRACFELLHAPFECGRLCYTLPRDLGRYVGAGRLDHDAVALKLLDVCELNSRFHKYDREWVRERILQGLADGAEDPRPLWGDRVYRSGDLPDLAPASTAADRSAVAERLLRDSFQVPQKGLAVVRLPVGAGKTHTALRLALEAVAQGQSVVFAVLDNQKAQDAEALALKIACDLAPGISDKVVRLRSKARVCDETRDRHKGLLTPKKLQAFEDDLPKLRADHAADLGEARDWRSSYVRRVCDKLDCPLRSMCEVAQGLLPQVTLQGNLSITTHAKLSTLEGLAECLVIIDEQPAEVATRSVDVTEIGELMRAAPWHAPSRKVLPLLLDALKKLEDEHAGEKMQLAPKSFADVLKASLQGDDVDAFVKSPPIKKASTQPGLRATLAAVCDFLRDCFSESPATSFSVIDHCGASQGVVSTRRRLHLPAGRVVVLDATATQEEWARRAGFEGRALTWLDSEEIKPNLCRALWWRTDAYRPSQLHSGHDLSDRGARNLETLSVFLEARLQHLPAGARVGIITHKKTRRHLEEACAGRGQLAASPIAATLRKYALTWGHYFADEVGSNAFRGCSLLILLGAPRRNYGAAVADAEVLRLDDDAAQAAYRRQTQRTIAQAIGRLRHYVDEGTQLLYVGGEDPTSCAEGLAWHTAEAVGRGNSLQTHNLRDDVRRRAVDALLGGLEVTKGHLREWGASEWITRSIWEGLLAGTEEGLKKQKATRSVTHAGRAQVVALTLPQVEAAPKAEDCVEQQPGDQTAAGELTEPLAPTAAGEAEAAAIPNAARQRSQGHSFRLMRDTGAHLAQQPLRTFTIALSRARERVAQVLSDELQQAQLQEIYT